MWEFSVRAIERAQYALENCDELFIQTSERDNQCCSTTVTLHIVWLLADKFLDRPVYDKLRINIYKLTK